MLLNLRISVRLDTLGSGLPIIGSFWSPDYTAMTVLTISESPAESLNEKYTFSAFEISENNRRKRRLQPVRDSETPESEKVFETR